MGKKPDEVVNKTVNDFQNGLETENRAAIQKVGKTISGALDSMNSNPSSLEELQKDFGQFYEVLLDTDVSSCPKDYRDQYAKTLDSIRSFDEILDTITAENSDEQMLHNIQKSRQNMYQQISELKSIAHSYHAD